MAGGGSVVARRQLGIRLRQLRLAAGKDVSDVVEANLGSKAKISRLEGGKGPVKVADVRALCWLYGADAATTEALAALAPGTQQEDSWAPAVPEWFGLYAGLEATASSVRCFEPQFVHGLVQTPEYARAVVGADPRLSADVIERRVKFRMERQNTPADVTIIMGEGALALVAGSPEIMAAQLDHLLEVSATIFVLPFSAGAYPRRGSFALLDFDSDEDPAIAYVEGPARALYLDKPQDRKEYEFVWDLFRDKSITIEEWMTRGRVDQGISQR